MDDARFFRVIARLDIKGSNVIKGIQYEGLRVMGDAHSVLASFYQMEPDEIVILDNVASLYGRAPFQDFPISVISELDIPVAMGGGVTKLADAEQLFSEGADKVVVNTGLFADEDLVDRLVSRFGGQSIVASIQAKAHGDEFFAYTHAGRENTGITVTSWCRRLEDMGVGEILITSVDADGTMAGMDGRLIKSIPENIAVPVICAGGLGKSSDLEVAATTGSVDGIAIAAALHYRKVSLKNLRENAARLGRRVRSV